MEGSRRQDSAARPPPLTRALRRSAALAALALLTLAAGGTTARAVSVCDPVLGLDCELWATRYDATGSDSIQNLNPEGALAIAVSPDSGTVYVTGQSPAANGNDDYVTAAYDSTTGATRWLSRYDDPSGGVDSADAIAVSPDGATVVVTGWSANTSNPDPYVDPIAIATVAYDAATGQQRWAVRYDPITGPGSGAGLAVAFSADGASIYVSGGSAGPDIAWDAVAIAYNITGQQRWVSRLSSGSGFGAAWVALTAGANLYVTGYTGSLATSQDYLTAALDPATGTRLWATTYDGPGSGSDDATALGVSPGRVFVTGESTGAAGNFDYATVAYDSTTGSQTWLARYNGPAVTGGDDAHAVAVSPGDADVFVTGESAGLGTADSLAYATVAYDGATGAQLWLARYSGNGAALNTTFDRDAAHALAVSADGARVFATGNSTGLTGDSDYATVAYAAGGPASTLPVPVLVPDARVLALPLVGVAALLVSRRRRTRP